MATLVENAAAIKGYAEGIDDAIVAKGGTTEGGLANAATAIASIPSGSPTQIDALSVTANGTYTAPSGHAYSPVTVNVTTEGYSGADAIVVYDTGLARSLTVTIYQSSQSCRVDWGDGTIESFSAWVSPTHTYQSHAIYNIRLTNHSQFSMNGDTSISDIYIGTSCGYKNGNYSTSNSNAMIHKNILSVSLDAILKDAVFGIDSFYKLGSSHTGEIRANCNIDATSCTSFATGRWGYLIPRKIDFGTNTVNVGHYGFDGENGNQLRWLFAGALVMSSGGEYCFYNFKGARLPDNIDMTSSSIGNDYMFNGCTALIQLPTNMRSNYSVSFAPCTGILIKDSVAEFTGGSITGGFVYNLNICPNSGQTITFNSQIKALFDATEQAAIESALTAKNWTCAW